MSNKVKIILILLSMLLVLGGVVAYLYFFGEKKYETVITNKDINGNIYTERQWEWNPQKSRVKINYVNTDNLDKIIVPLHIGEYCFVDIALPNIKYINDYGKTICAVDGSYTVRVIGDTNIGDLASLAGLSNPTYINDNTICSDSNTKGKMTIARYIDGCCILADIYTGDSTYSILRDCLSDEEMSVYSYKNESYKDYANNLENIVYNGQFCAQVSMQEVSLESHRYLFEEGFLWQQSNMIQFYETERQYIAKLEKLAGCSVEEYYINGQLLYAKAGDFYVGLVAYNSNTTLSMLGQGDEAKCNIVTVLNSLQ